MGEVAREQEHAPDHPATEVRYNADGTSHRGSVGLGADSGLPARRGILSSIAPAGPGCCSEPQGFGFSRCPQHYPGRFRETRIRLSGRLSREFGIPVLSHDSQCATKLLANADRCLDRSVGYRDAIDLGYLVAGAGMLPAASVCAAERAYGAAIPRSIRNVLERLSDPEERAAAAETLNMQPTEVGLAAGNLRKACVLAWPEADLRVMFCCFS